MSDFIYRDFELEIANDDNSSMYVANVLRSPAGESFEEKIDLSELKAKWTKVDWEKVFARPLEANLTAIGQTEATPVTKDDLEEFGVDLFQKIFTESVKSVFDRSMDEVQRQNAKLRLRLRLRKVPELINLPWEYLRNSDASAAYNLATKLSFVRYLEVDERISNLHPVSQLRILVVISNPRRDLDVDKEWKGLEGAVKDQKNITLIHLPRASLNELQNALKGQEPYHVLHFIGHGKEGVLLFEHDDGSEHKVNAEELAMHLDGTPLKLVVLNACEGAVTLSDQPFDGVAQRLLHVPAVVAMQAPISDPSAIAFSTKFYASLGNGGSVDTAMIEARIAMRSASSAEFGIPVLYMRSRHGRLFNVADQQPKTPVVSLEDPEGMNNPNSYYYVRRRSDDLARQAIKNSGVTITIKAPSGFGGRLLLLGTVSAARKFGKRVVMLNCGVFDTSALKDENRFFRQFCQMVSEELGLDKDPNLHQVIADFWDASKNDWGNAFRCARFFAEYVLRNLNDKQGIVLALDGVELLFNTPFLSELLGMINYWHDHRALDTDWQKLDLILATSTEPQYFGDDYRKAFFAAGQVIELGDFNEDEIRDLNQRYGAPLTDEEIQKLQTLIGGHPYLIQRSLYLVASRTSSFEQVFKEAIADPGLFQRFLRLQYSKIDSEKPLKDALKAVLDNRKIDELTFFRLQGTGLVTRRNGKIEMYCKLFEDYFKDRYDNSETVTPVPSDQETHVPRV